METQQQQLNTSTSSAQGIKVCVIGGVAGGASFSTRARRLSEASHIIMFEKGDNASYANCGMPYFLGNTIKNRQELIITSPATLTGRYNIDLRTQTEIVKIDRQKKTITAINKTKGEYEETYDKLVIATGSVAFIPMAEGMESVKDRFFTLKTLEDMDRIKPFVKQGSTALVIGGGFIGVEVASELQEAGLKVHLVEMTDQLMPAYDKEMTVPLSRAFAKHGVDLLFGQTCTKFEKKEDKVLVNLSTGKQLEVDFVVCGVGARPDTKLANMAGLTLGPRGGILVSESMVTSDPDIYAVGDNIEVKDFILGVATYIPLAGIANKQGRVAANHLFGSTPNKVRGVQATNICAAYGVTVASTGLTEKALKRAGITEYEKIYTHVGDHAAYYPGAQRMQLKLLFNPKTGKILGCQGVGGTVGVDKRIDVVSMCIQGGMTVYDMEDAELAYSPQFGSAKDPINMLGMIASGICRGDQHVIQLETVLKNPEQYELIDVRTPKEFSEGALPTAVNIPVDEIRNRVKEIKAEKPVVTYCRIGMRGYMAQRILQQSGLQNVHNITGGYELFQKYMP